METKVLKIEGMTCASCAITVEKATKKMQGVTESSVNIATEKLNISFDETIVSVEDIQAAVEKAGYKALSDTVSKTMKIEGMTCSSCAQTIEKVTKKGLNLLDSRINVQYWKILDIVVL